MNLDDKVVYINGCSYAWGMDSIPGYTRTGYSDTTEHAYAFGNHLGAKRSINDSWPGSSNTGIATRTVDWMERNPPPDIAILAWSSYTRIGIPQDPQFPSTDRLGQHVLKKFDHYHIEEKVMEFQSVTQVLSIDGYLRNKGITPFHFCAFDYIKHEYLDTISDRWFLYNNTWAHHYNMTLWKEGHDGLYHPTFDEHQRFAAELKEFIENYG